MDSALDVVADLASGGPSQRAGLVAGDVIVSINGKSVKTSSELTREVARARDLGEDFSVAASMAKVQASDVAMRVTTDAVQLHGGYGYMQEYAVERFMREAKALQIVEGTNQIQRMIIGRHLSGK